MNKAIIGLASNRNNGDIILKHAITELMHDCISARFSECYRTIPIGTWSKRNYWNCTGIIETELDLNQLKKLYKTMEKQAGRMPDSNQTGDIPLDIDIVVWNSNIIRPYDWEQSYFQKGLNMISD